MSFQEMEYTFFEDLDYYELDFMEAFHDAVEDQVNFIDKEY
tara:strand:- start:2509 stop:2631 length:123 start_codon:yes stop_codon:yes gene_type:complete